MDNAFSNNSIDDDVYLGVWINRSRGNGLQGATLTLDRRSGSLLIAVLALYVGATGNAFWKISRFILHYVLSSTTHPDGVYHQRQAILRNSETPLDAVLILIKATFSWRLRARRSYIRLVPVLILALLIWAAFSVAGRVSFETYHMAHANKCSA
jgi:hypothetical protein